jgi:hypothetical protein
VLADAEGILYLLEADDDICGGASLTINSFCFEGTKVKEIDTPRTALLEKHFKEKASSLSNKELSAYLTQILDAELEIPALHKDKFGEQFSHLYLTDTDDELIYQNPHAKHLIIDFEHLEHTGELKLITPPLFPFVIENLNTTVTEDARLIDASGKEIDIETLDAHHTAYRRSRLPKILEIDKMYDKIEQEYKEDFFSMKHSIPPNRHGKPAAYNLVVVVYDEVSQSGNPIHEIYFAEGIFKDETRYSLAFLGFPEIEVSNLFYYMYDRFGFGLLDAELTLFTQVEMLRQTEYRC